MLRRGAGLMASGLLAVSVTFSSWVFYVVEIDALSNLAFIPFLPFMFSFLGDVSRSTCISSRYLFGLMLGAMYIVYPEFAAICLLSLLLVLVVDMIRGSGGNAVSVVYRGGVVVISFLLVVLLYYRQSVPFLLSQTVNGANSINNWWGYYGAYLLGPNSPVTNPDVVSHMVKLVALEPVLYKNPEAVDLILKYSLNILPVVFGLFHVVSVEFYLIPVNLFSLFLLCVMVSFLFVANSFGDKWLRCLMFVLLFLVFLLVARGSYWAAVKAVSYFQLLLPLVFLSVYTLASRVMWRRVMVAYFIVLPFFILYKYSVNNCGIGRYDGFPSILHKEQKVGHVWHFDLDVYGGSRAILIDSADPFVRHFYILQAENNRLLYVTRYPLRESYGYGNVIATPHTNIRPDIYLH